MTFDSPIPFSKALEILRQKNALPTDLSSADLKSLDVDIRRGSLFSARTLSADYLEETRTVVSGMADGSINEATGRQQLQHCLERLGYTPEHHFGTAADLKIPPAEAGSLQDLASDSRIKLILQTQTRLANNVGFMTAGLSPIAMHQFPAYELVRIFPRVHPRGETDKPDDEGWPDRWEQAGGELVEGRMIALKNDEIWENLGDSSLFDDGMDTDAPPYAYNSGMGLRQVDRDTCIELGLIDEDEDLKPPKKPGLASWLDSVPQATKPLADMRADRDQLLAAIAARSSPLLANNRQLLFSGKSAICNPQSAIGKGAA